MTISAVSSTFSPPVSRSDTVETPGAAESRKGNRELSREEEKEVRELKTRDAEVRAHEQAHAAAGGQYAGSPSFEFQTGPDGRRYAVGGEVSIDTSEVADDPEATIRKMQVVRKAALAPAQPSAQDRSVAATASRKEAVARRELAGQKQAEAQSPKNGERSSIRGYTSRGTAVPGAAAVRAAFSVVG